MSILRLIITVGSEQWAFVEQPQPAICLEVVPPHELATIFAAAR
jgi:hypothetical protein